MTYQRKDSKYGKRHHIYEERRSATVTRKMEAKYAKPLTLAQTFWAEYYRLSSTRVTDKTPQFAAATLEEIAYCMALKESDVLGMISGMLADGITHRDPQGEMLSAILSEGLVSA